MSLELPHDKSEWERVLAEASGIIQEFYAAATKGDTADGLMFRGQRKAEWTLLPSLYRHADARENESNIYQIFTTKAKALMPHIVSDWEILSHMQHYGVPTRLLDWSDSFGVALYFAISKQAIRKPEDAAVWILNGYALSRLATKKGSIYNIEAEDFPLYSEYFTDRASPLQDENEIQKKWPFERPVPIEAAWGHQRIIAQRGLFTVHGNCDKPIEEQIDSSMLRKVIVPQNAILYARQYLRLAGIDHYTIFPDLEGLSQCIKDMYFDNNLEVFQKVGII